MNNFNPRLGERVICRQQVAQVVGIDLPGRYVRYLVEFPDGSMIWRWLFQLDPLDAFDFEADGTHPEMIENQRGLMSGEDWLEDVWFEQAEPSIEYMESMLNFTGCHLIQDEYERWRVVDHIVGNVTCWWVRRDDAIIEAYDRLFGD